MQESSNKYDPNLIGDINDELLSLECLDKLGLEENPFVDHARDPYLFVDKQIEMSINVLIDYLKNQNSTLVLFGEAGVGKTTHLRILLRKGYDDFNFCTLRAKPDTDYAKIEKQFKKRWRTTTKNNQELEGENYIKEFIDQGRQPVLVIDDAHRLDTETLDILMQLKHRVGLQTSRPLGLIFAAEPEIQSKLSELEKSNPAATQIFQVNVRVFDTEQTENYINYRLGKAQNNGTQIFSAEDIQAIHKNSLGLPKIINQLAREQLSAKCNEATQPGFISKNYQNAPWFRLAVVLLAIVGAGLLFFIFSNDDSTTQDIELDLTKEENVIEKPAAKKTITKPYVAPLVLGPLQLDDEKEQETSAKPSKEQPKPTNTTSVPLSKTHSSDWLMNQDPNDFTIQVVTSSNKDNLIAFANENLKGYETAYYKKLVDNKSWFVLVVGLYNSRELAISAIENLPTNIKENKPYPLQIKSIQDIIQ